MDSPGGGPFLRDVVGVFMLLAKVFMSPVREPSSSWGPFPCFCRASMICLCLSRTSILRCSCSRMVGSWVWKPGDRQASPTSCIEALSFPVKGADGRAERAPELGSVVDKSNRRGLWREVVRSGEEGSFLTTILGLGAPPRALLIDLRLEGVA